MRGYRGNLDNLPDMMGKTAVWRKMESIMMIFIVRKWGPGAFCITEDLKGSGSFG